MEVLKKNLVFQRNPTVLNFFHFEWTISPENITLDTKFDHKPSRWVLYYPNMSNFDTNLKVGFPPIWAPTNQKAPLCIVPKSLLRNNTEIQKQLKII